MLTSENLGSSKIAAIPATTALAISVSPSGTGLADSDFGDQTIYASKPDRPASANRYPMSSSLMVSSGLSVTDSGMVYFVTGDIGGTGADAFHKLDTSTGLNSDLYFFYHAEKIYPRNGGHR